jgi:hypothetical protein
MTDPKPPKAPASTAPAAKAPKPPAAKAPAVPPAPPAPPKPPAPPAPQPYAQQQPYGGVAYQPSMGPRTNVLAIVSLVSSLAGIIIPFLAPVAGIITGHLALGQIKRTGEGGHGLALAGVIIGYVLAGMAILILIFYIIFFVALLSSGVLEPGVVI